MKTVFIDASPKKKLSASGFIAGMTRLFTSGKKVLCKLRTPADYQSVQEQIQDADSVVFSMPLYVDGVPSHVLPFLKELEAAYKGTSSGKRIYVIANNGFIEGRQNEPLMRVMENFSDRAGFTWCGGLGIGGGVMMNVMRILICVFFCVTLVQMALNSFNLAYLKDFGFDVLGVLFFGSGIICYDIALARHISRGKDYGKKYTRIMVPSFIFILFADLFFTITSLFQGGMFRGWLSRKYGHQQ